MNVYTIKCPNCGADAPMHRGTNFAVCEYCGSKVISDTEQISAPLEKELMFLADSALAACDYSEAERYYTRILESDAENPDAWIGKGIAAGMLCNKTSFIEETAFSFTNAVKYGLSAGQWQRMAEHAVIIISSALIKLKKEEEKSEEAEERAGKDACNENETDSIAEYRKNATAVFGSGEKIVNLFAESRNGMLSGEPDAIAPFNKNLLLVAKCLIENEIASGDFYHEHNGHETPPEIEAQNKERIERIEKIIRAVIPSYSSGYVKHKKFHSCLFYFVILAVIFGGVGGVLLLISSIH